MTERELALIVAWYQAGTVKGAAERIGVAEQTAKNMLLTARLRAGVRTNVELVAANLDRVLERAGYPAS